MAQVEGDVRARHRQPADDVDAGGELGALGFEELAPRRDLREQPLDRDARPRRQRGGTVGDDPAVVDGQRPAVAPAHPAGERQPRDAGDRRQRLAAEAERGDRRQVAVGQFRRRVALDREPQLGRGHAAAIVGNRQEVGTAAGELDGDGARPGVDRILDEFLERRRRPLDDFAGGDLVDELVGQAADRHAPGLVERSRAVTPGHRNPIAVPETTLRKCKDSRQFSGVAPRNLARRSFRSLVNTL